MLWYLWSRNRREVPEGIYSHETALSLHELSDVMPSKLHMTVPKDFRRNSMIPEVLILHRANVDKATFKRCTVCAQHVRCERLSICCGASRSTRVN